MRRRARKAANLSALSLNSRLCLRAYTAGRGVGGGRALITSLKEATVLTFSFPGWCSAAPLLLSLPFNKDRAGKRGGCEIQLTQASNGTGSTWCRLPPAPATPGRPSAASYRPARGRGAVRASRFPGKRPQVKVTPSSSWQHWGVERNGGMQYICGASGCPAPQSPPPPAPASPLLLRVDETPLSVSHHMDLPASEGGGLEVCRIGPRPCAGSQEPPRAGVGGAGSAAGRCFLSGAERRGAEPGVCRWAGVRRDPGGL